MVRRILIAVALVVVVGAALVWWLRGTLAMRALPGVVERNLTTDPIAELPDGLHLLVCGAGGPLPDPVRSGPCLAVIAGRSLFVVDVAAESARNLGRMRLGPALVEAVFLTHFHSDHIDGLGALATLRWAGGNHASPLPVHGPPGVGEVVEGFNRAYRMDVEYRVAHHGEAVVPRSGAGLSARPLLMPAGASSTVALERDDLVVRMFRVDHDPVDPAVGYRFDYKGRSLAISGDTSYVPALAEHARGVDLLAHEALSARIVGAMREGAVAAERPLTAKILADIPDYHATPVQAAEVAEAAGARHLLYYHVVPPLPAPGMEEVFLEGVSDAYAGGVTLSRDGVFVSLPAGSQEIDISSR